jgi:crotonobetainyl-CoA:carnitine CoA-transferase CaiB-like acyl-CoA transferase
MGTWEILEVVMEQALSDVRVLDLTHYVAGPYCTKLLADYGAQVIKVEKPGEGDRARRIGPFFKDDPHPEKSGLFLHLNTNKKGISLNLKTHKLEGKISKGSPGYIFQTPTEDRHNGPSKREASLQE